MSAAAQARSMRLKGYPEDYIEERMLRERLAHPPMILVGPVGIEIGPVAFPVHDAPGEPPCEWGMTQREADLHRVAENRRRVAQRYFRKAAAICGVIEGFHALNPARQREVDPGRLVSDVVAALSTE